MPFYFLCFDKTTGATLTRIHLSVVDFIKLSLYVNTWHSLLIEGSLWESMLCKYFLLPQTTILLVLKTWDLYEFVPFWVHSEKRYLIPLWREAPKIVPFWGVSLIFEKESFSRKGPKRTAKRTTAKLFYIGSPFRLFLPFSAKRSPFRRFSETAIGRWVRDHQMDPLFSQCTGIPFCIFCFGCTLRTTSSFSCWSSPDRD